MKALNRPWGGRRTPFLVTLGAALVVVTLLASMAASPSVGRVAQSLLSQLTSIAHGVAIPPVDGTNVSSPNGSSSLGNDGGCAPQPGHPCTEALAGDEWTFTPPLTWCTSVSYTAWGLNGSYTSWETHCAIGGALVVAWDSNRSTLLNGTVEVDGPSAIWLVSSAYTCELESQLMHMALPCPPPFSGNSSYYEWNESVPTAGPIDLGALSFGLASAPGELPAGAWFLILVDGQSTPETARASTSLMLAAV